MLEHARLRSIIDAQQALLEVEDVDAALAAITRHAMELCGATGAVVELASRGEMIYHAVAGTLAPYNGMRLRTARSLSGLCVEQGVPLRTDDALADPRTDHAACQRLGVVSMLCVPIGGDYPGVLKVISDRRAAFDDDDAEVLAIFVRTIVSRLDATRRRRLSQSSISTRPELDGAFCRAIVDSMQDAVAVMDMSGRLILANATMRQLVPQNRDPLETPVHTSDSPAPLPAAERPYMRALRGETIRDAEVMLRDVSGNERWLSVNTSPVRDGDGQVVGVVSVARDITEQRDARGRLESAAAQDELTKLLNRRGFLERATSALRDAERTGRPVALLYLDLNGMKAINDRHGHAAGDRALVELADVLRAVLRADDVAARLGGDEYAVLARECNTPDDAERLRGRLAAAIRDRNTQPGRDYHLSASIGALHHDPRHPSTIDQLLRDADALMYTAKQARKLDGSQPLVVIGRVVTRTQ
ncbi:MAG: diguanylate cyclase [Deltaproteobacteria bacterium]|nr:diguanylate cyclase [Deltaproteobacteria bacterium]